MVRQDYSLEGDFGGTFPDSGFDWEVIVVDDASPDGTQEVAKQLARVYGDDRIVCLFVFIITFTNRITCVGVETSGRQARAGVRVSGFHSFSLSRHTVVVPPTSTVWSFALEIL